MTPEDLGALKDHFGLLSEDHNSLNLAELRSFLGDTLTKADLAKSLGISRTRLYEKQVKLSKEFMRTKMIPIIQTADLAYEIFKNEESTRRWILSPNSYFFGKSPLEVCLLGEGPELINFLNRKLGYDNDQKAK